jgi:hypothetical protein
MPVEFTVFIDVHVGPGTGLHKDSNIGISRDAVVGFAVLTVDQTAASAAFLKDWRWADRETALVKNLLVPASIDFSRSPRADAGCPRVLQVRINVEAI